MTPKYKTTIPITEEELKDFTIIKASLEQMMQKPLTIRATFRILLQYFKKKIDSEDFKNEISSIEKREEIKEEASQKEIAKKEDEIEKQEKRSLFSQLFRKR